MVFRRVNWKGFIIKWMANKMERSSVTIRIQIQEVEKMVRLLIKKNKNIMEVGTEEEMISTGPPQ